MERRNDESYPFNPITSAFRQPARRRLWRTLLIIGLLPALLLLACTLPGLAGRLRPDRVVIRTHLPTLTRTPLPHLTATPKTQAAALAPRAGETFPNPPPPVGPPTPLHRFFIPTFTPAPVTGPQAAQPAPPADAAATGATPAGALASNTSGQPTTAPPPFPTASPTGLPTELPTETPLPTATDEPLPTSTPTEIPSPTPLPQDWVFSSMHGYPAEALNGMVFYGNLMNNTGGAQQLKEINTTLYDAQGQVIPYQKAVDQWPVRVVPQGGEVPFGVVIPNIQGVADFDFEVQSEPGGDIPREDFEFVDVNPSPEGEQYCLNGRLQNHGGQLQAYLMVTAVLYDGQDQVINYNNAFKSAPKEIVGDETLELNLCVKTHRQEVARYELRAWGI